MKLGTEVGIDPGHIVLDGDPAPPKGAQPADFRPMSVVAKRLDGWIKMPLSTVVGLGPGDIMLDGDPASPRKRHSSPPLLRPMSIAAKRSPISAIAELLLT